MGRAIDQDKRIDALEVKVSEILSILDELSKTNSKQTQVDLHETTKVEKSNDEGSGDSGKQSDNGKSKPKAKPRSSSKDSK